MKKAAFIFVLAIFLPAIFLGILALRTTREQQFILEKQEAVFKQKEVDTIAKQIQTAFFQEHKSFETAVNTLLTDRDPYLLADNFKSYLPKVFQRKGVPFAVSKSGSILFPSKQRSADQEEKDFLQKNEAFLENQAAEEVYQAVNPATIAQNNSKSDVSLSPNSNTSSAKKTPAPTKKSSAQAQSRPQPLRKVQPQQLASPKISASPTSQINVFSGIFDQIISEQSSGILSRLVQGETEIWFWMRCPQESELIFGIRFTPEDFRDLFKKIFLEAQLDANADFCALLNDRAEPFLDSSSEFESYTFNWRKPFVATEIGEILPYWEIALYLKNPQLLSHSAQTMRLILISLTILALGAIGLGSYFIVNHTRKQMVMAQKKSDFVSNVSHELKTPLTSIRMFAELLQQDHSKDSKKTSRFLNVIVSETERLTRLINNILDFAKIERNQKSYYKKPFDLYLTLERIWETLEMHLINAGFQTQSEAISPPYWIYGDEDAITQAITNLLSNAEKYSPETKEIELRSEKNQNQICISILDRGLGVPKDKEVKIFEHFYRADNSLSSGIQGTGLGLTIAQKIIEEHEGVITYQARPGGGSIFTIRIPETQK